MPIVEHSVTVDGSIDDVFDLSQSYELSRRGLRMVTDDLIVRRPDLVEMNMIERPRILRTFSASWRFTANDHGCVDVALGYDFTCTPTWLAPVTERIGVWYLGRDIAKRLEAFRVACDDTDLLDQVRDSRPTTTDEHRTRPRTGDGDSPGASDSVAPIVDAAWAHDRLLHDPTIVICHVGSTMAGADPLADFEHRHLPGARFVSLDDVLAAPASGTAGRHPLPSPSDFAQSLGELGISHDATVVAYDDRGGAFAARLVWMLRILGRRAALLDGGFDGWPGEIEHGAPVVMPVAHPTVDWPLDALADAIDVARHIDRDGVVIDSRDPARYAGDIEPIDTVAGHIPGAVNLPFADNFDREGHFRTVAELAARFSPTIAVGQDGGTGDRTGDTNQDDAADGTGGDGRGIRNPTIVYCGSGVTACVNALAMERAGLGLPRVYVGSWSGWTADPDRSVATGATP